MKLVNNGKFDFAKSIREHAVAAIIISALLIVVGVLLIVTPLISTGVIIWVVIGLLGLGGLALIVHFFFPGGKERSVVSFIFGLLVVALVVLIIIDAATHKPVQIQGEIVSGFAYVTSRMIVFISIFFGVFAVFTSTFELFSLGNVEEGTRGWHILGCILSIILGILMAIFPFIMTMVGTIIAGVYTIIVSITAIVLAAKAIKLSKKAK